MKSYQPVDKKEVNITKKIFDNHSKVESRVFGKNIVNRNEKLIPNDLKNKKANIIKKKFQKETSNKIRGDKKINADNDENKFSLSNSNKVNNDNPVIRHKAYKTKLSTAQKNFISSIDEEMKDNIQYTTEYISDIFSYIIAQEVTNIKLE